MKMIVLLLLISQHASGVEVYKGAESVLLPCHVSVDVSSNDTAAVWNRVGLSNPTVHLRLQKSDDLKGQNDLYKHRTSMRVDALQTGVLSLTLKNPTFSDSGTYTCIYRKYGQDLSKTEVQLKVTEPPPVWPKVLSAVLVPLIIPAAAFGLFMCCAYKRMKNREALQPEVVEEPQGEKSVVLPFKTTAVLPQDVTVEWTLTEPKHMQVHVYESGKNQPNKQNQGYRGRTAMNEDPLRTKDLSLTLKHLRPTDSGVYTCTVNKDGNKLLQKSVTLSVRVPPPEVVNATQADESVLLPFKPTADLPQDVTVEWRDSNNMKVHVYESGNNQPDKQDQGYRGRTGMKEDPLRTKDLSLTLKDLHLSDSGVYTCTVYNKDGNMLLQKSVTLSVFDTIDWKRTVCGNKSYLLEFEKTCKLHQISKVKWERIYPEYKFIKEIEKHQGNEEDLSLTLEDRPLTDGDIYSCTAYDNDGAILLRRSVIVNVKVVAPNIKEVQQRQESVVLPFKTKADLPWDVTVEWRDSNNMKVHVYESGNNQPDKQDQVYRGRTGMDEDALRTGDLSLTLKDLHLSDSGVYTCTVYNKDGHMLLQKSVTLSVFDHTMRSLATVSGNKSYLLEFKKTDKLDQISKVKWEHIHPKYKLIKEIPRHQGNDKDFSLNLEDPCLTDSGIYTCTAYDNDGDILLRQSVTFSVRDFQLEKVEVTEGVESVLLPFKTTADLHHVVEVYWTVSEPKLMMVHYFDVKNKNNQPNLQDKLYIGRTEMNKDPLRTGDLSLTLKKPLPTDSRSYTCTVYNKDKRILLQKVVTLRVRATLTGAMADMLSQLRRGKAPKPEVKEDVRSRSYEDVPLMEVHSA